MPDSAGNYKGLAVPDTAPWPNDPLRKCEACGGYRLRDQFHVQDGELRCPGCVLIGPYE